MSYEKNTWQNGDIITAEKLNNIETGVADSPFFVAASIYDEDAGKSHLNKTAAEIKAALDNGKLLIIQVPTDLAPGTYEYYQYIPSGIQCGDDDDPWINIGPAYISNGQSTSSYASPDGVTDMNFYPVEYNGD